MPPLLRTPHIILLALWFTGFTILYDSLHTWTAPENRGIGFEHEERLRPFCLASPFFGQTSNNIIEVGKVLNLIRIEGKKRLLGLDKNWSAWYQSNFDVSHEILLHYSGACEKVFDGRKAFFSDGWNLTHLKFFVPSKKIRATAEEIMDSWPHGKNFISVHRRELDGWCHLFARCSKVRHSNCTRIRDKKQPCTADIRHKACDIQYEMIPNRQELPVVLFTDGQAPWKDATFPFIFRYPQLLVEMWLMVNSEIHWGNPRSTLDIVVASWRRGKGMEPKECYPPFDILYQP